MRANALMDPLTANTRRPLTASRGFLGCDAGARRNSRRRRLVLKHLPSEGDCSRGRRRRGRVRRLWRQACRPHRAVRRPHDPRRPRARRPRRRDHARRRWGVACRRASESRARPRAPCLSRLADLHDGCEGESGDGLCAIAARYAMFAPVLHGADGRPGAHPLAARIAQGWELFAQHVDDDTAAAVFAIHRRARASRPAPCPFPAHAAAR